MTGPAEFDASSRQCWQGLLQRCPRLSGIAHSGGVRAGHAKAVKFAVSSPTIDPSRQRFVDL